MPKTETERLKMVKDVDDFFPPGLALGIAFCNRVGERETIKNALLRGEHIVIVSPRRYGKTSLITQVIQENKISFSSMDFLPATNSQYVKNVILTGISESLSQVLPKQKVMAEKLLGFLKGFNFKLSGSWHGFGVGVELFSSSPPYESITNALMGLDKVAQEVNKKVVLLMDEFQQVRSISESHTIEASIRHAVERSKMVTYVFSGSDRHTLEQMFNDKSRPLYHLCKLIRIDRIHKEDFAKFIQEASVVKWGKPLDNYVVEKILGLTECHTFYVNYLCRQLWGYKEMPTEDAVEQEWERYVKNQLPWITDDIARLSANQRAVLSALVINPTKEIFKQQFLDQVGLQISSIKRAIDSLQKSNMVYKNENGVYFVLDPAIANHLRTIKLLFENR